ncbi:helix-turn-helix transcriptional regulator (plasmid) [Vibrio parahaemolyticus]|uniref:helix-turn-helix domain-containing protein n=1 Tax=Vibrio parahaemolyticus TaxID=670 RepID=UPI002048CF6B|nr:helix-turn-helix transcriptional regulator [Vibrio parahaemolyticus]UPR42103.1 helix-turn-helix transcriptional regulator [Vibrio parahaemolyticus]
MEQQVLLLGKKIKEARKKKKLTIEDLASKSGLSVAHLSRLENGRKSPTITTLEKNRFSLGRTYRLLFLVFYKLFF